MQALCVLQNKCLMSGDVELNPGPVQTENCNVELSSHARLELDSSLYSDASHHLSIRTAGVAYMRENPEKFSESNTKNSWLHYLNSMSRQGTWADGLIIQEDFETKQKSNEKRKQYIKNKRSTQDADSKKKNNVIYRQYMKRKRADAQILSVSYRILSVFELKVSFFWQLFLQVQLIQVCHIKASTT